MNQTPQEHPPETVAKGTTKIDADNAKHRVRADLKAYLDGELSMPRRWLTNRHITACALCRAEMRGLEQLSRQVRTMDQAMPDARLRGRILASLPAAPPVSRLQITNARPIGQPSRRAQFALAGLCALLLMSGAFALSRFSGNGTVAHATATNDNVAVNTPLYNKSATAYNIAQTPVSVTPDSQSDNTTFGANGSAQAGQNAAPAYTDPTSAEADRIAAILIPTKLREKRQLIASREASANAAKPGQPAVKTIAPPPMQVAVAVTNVSEASRRVKKWAEEAGAQVTTLAYTMDNSKLEDAAAGAAMHSAEPVHTPADGGEAGLPTPAAMSQTPALLRLKVPARQADSLRAYLGHMGTPVAVVPGMPGGRIPMLRPLNMEEFASHPGSPVALPAFAPQSATTGERPATVTIVLRLQTGSLPR